MIKHRAGGQHEITPKAGVTVGAALAGGAGVAGVRQPRPGQPDRAGRLQTGDSVLRQDNSLYGSYTFEAAEGMRITLTLL
jgi:hypothetical protein